MWISQPIGHDPPPKGEVRDESRSAQKSRACCQDLSAIQIYHLQQFSLLLSKNWQNQNRSDLPHPGPRTGAKNRPAKNFGRHPPQSMRSIESTRPTRGRTAACNAFNNSSSGRVFAGNSSKNKGGKISLSQWWKVGCLGHRLPQFRSVVLASQKGTHLMT